MLFDMKLINEIGLFDDQFFLYFEETDLCRRIRDAGYKILQLSNVLVEHQKGASCQLTDRDHRMKSWHFGWSRAYFHNKHGIGFLPQLSNFKRALLYFVKSLLTLSKKKRTSLRYKSFGTFAYILGKRAFYKDDSAYLSGW